MRINRSGPILFCFCSPNTTLHYPDEGRYNAHPNRKSKNKIRRGIQPGSWPTGVAFEARRVVHPFFQTDARAAAVAAQGLLARVLHAGAVHWIMSVVAAAEAANTIAGEASLI